jgi:myo-inositol 2-dehydrogenase / D-chiro-inositol 1-dehydrogenase
MQQVNTERRDFLKTTGAALVAGFPAILKGAPVSNSIKVGLVGCGGRGTGAASQALKADDYAELTAVADIYQERIDQCLSQLGRRSAAKVKVDPSNKFIGLDAYQKLIDSGVDVVLLASVLHICGPRSTPSVTFSAKSRLQWTLSECATCSTQ